MLKTLGGKTKGLYIHLSTKQDKSLKEISKSILPSTFQEHKDYIYLKNAKFKTILLVIMSHSHWIYFYPG